MKLNKKGITLVELIVSFVLVSVAIIYFYQTLFTVKKIYTKSQKETNSFVEVNYAYRLIDAFFENEENLDDFCTNAMDDDSIINPYFTGDSCIVENEKFYEIHFEVDGKDYVLYKSK